MTFARAARGIGALVVLTTALAACTSADVLPRQVSPARTSTPAPAPDPSPVPSRTPSPRPDPTTSPAQQEPTSAAARIMRVPARQWAAMVDAGMWRPGCPASRRELRRVEVNHHTFAGGVERGVLVVNADVAPSIARIFTTLFRAEFPIRRMRPVEAYDGDSDASLRADNTAAYNCRRPDQINAPPKASPHANGRAIDVNPRENPWRDPRCRCWSPSARHHARVPGPGKIVRGGLVWQAFTREGWIWQNIDVADYMHFDTGYPSRPFPRGAGNP